jgi:hypothetical protein
MRAAITIIFLLTILTSAVGQDGSDIRYFKIESLDNSLNGQYAHIDFYRWSFRSKISKIIDTVTIIVDNKDIRFIEKRNDDGFNNWFNQQYLESEKNVDGQMIRITKSKIKNINTDSLFVTSYIEYFDSKGELIVEKSRQEDFKFEKKVIAGLLIQASQ